MIEFKNPDFLISLQAQMLSLNRSSLYYKPLPSSEWDLQLKGSLTSPTRSIRNLDTAVLLPGWKAITDSMRTGKLYWHACSRWGYRRSIPGRILAGRTRQIKSIPLPFKGRRSQLSGSCMEY